MKDVNAIEKSVTIGEGVKLERHTHKSLLRPFPMSE
jgi:hypothetical protein